MFSDNKQLIGSHWLYDDLVESMKDFDASTVAYSSVEPYMTVSELKEVQYANELSDEQLEKEWYRLLNMNRYLVYMKNNEAKIVHQYLLYNKVFTKNQWDKTLCPMIKVFDFNADYERFEKEIIIHAESYIVKYANQIMSELNRGILAVFPVTDFDIAFDMFREEKKDSDDGIYFNVIYFLGTVILDFCRNWPDAKFTVQRRLSKYISTIASLSNPHWNTVFH